LLVTLATQAGLVVSEAMIRERNVEAERVADRTRIALSLQDAVVERVFSASLALSSVVQDVDDRTVRERILEVIDDMDDAIRSIRRAVFDA
jgi:signal transduction histidine kinase